MTIEENNCEDCTLKELIIMCTISGKNKDECSFHGNSK